MTETSPCEIIVGADTHKDTHAAVAINTLGARLGAMTIPVSTTGYRDLEAWAKPFGPIRAFGIEGIVCYGAGLSREGFKGRVATYIERIQFRREAPWTRSARTARVSI